ncbi:tubulin epsilon and delta complex protein 1 isoform X3 [Poeciliopsis prolifica]|uniref:tubulin epsilon and delta complex protein 1 isoform X3 n=1 Tax=Poeciliopsis prolifica TaxID=188132 RepID=UPI002412F495|nr:tubulin epsilon and delta complex protein 1 isoform X3 [Poeciliopsis prolifica]
MQRSQAAGSVDVRRVIGSLCRLLAGLGLDPVPAPDAFRRAKFGGGPEDSFWLLLSNILQRSGVIFSETICQPTGGSKELVVAGLWQSGYHGDWTSGGSGSDPLLALGWLLAQGVLEKLLAGQVAVLDRTLLDTWPVSTGTRTLEPALPDSISLRTLQWLMGRLRHQGRTLLCTTRGRTRALHDDSACIQRLCDVLEAYLSWRRVENVFWTWMDSVADRRHGVPQAATPFRALGTCHHGNQGLAQLEQLLMKLPIAQETESLQGQRSQDHQACTSPVLSVPSIRQVWRPRLQAGARGPPASPPALERLLQAERLLLRHRAARRLANRKRLQLLMRRLRRRVFVPM